MAFARESRRLFFTAFIFPLAFLSGCAHAPLNQPATQTEIREILEISEATLSVPAEKTSDLAVYLFFSGGGKRASAFSYGVLKELAGTTAAIDGQQRRLLDSVEFISSVSGGSFTAAYYCLHKDRTFEDYEKQFLKRNTNRALILQLANPAWWPALWSRYYARGDLAAHYYDKTMFHGATFDDLARAGGKPLLFINATDVASGEQFPFSRLSFLGMLSSNHGSYSIARAVTASSAVPVLFTPITLKNHTDSQHPAAMPAWLAAQPDDPSAPSAARRRELQKVRDSYADSGEHPYLHLVDGGLSDNLGLSSLANASLMCGGMGEFLTLMKLSHPRKALVIVVNAAAHRESDLPRRQKTPGAFETITLLGDNRGEKDNALALEYARTVFTESRRAREAASAGWHEENAPGASGVKKAGARPPPIPETYMVMIDFNQITNPGERAFLQNQPTSFHLPDKAIDRLTEAGGRLLRESPEFQRLLRTLNHEAGNN